MGIRGKNRDKKLIAASAILLILSFAFQIIARKVPGFGDQYAEFIYPLLVGTIGRFFDLFPFAVVEFFAYALILYCIGYGIRHFRKGTRLLIRALFLAACLFSLFTFNCGINYYRTPFSKTSGLPVKKSSEDELISFCLQLTEIIDGMCEEGITEHVNTSLVKTESVKAMAKLGETYPDLSGYYPEPKPYLLSQYFSVQQLCGQYSPFTVEATYNCSMPDYNIPHTVCHELSHLRGFMREDEANFIGYLACIGSDNEAFRYSGYLTGGSMRPMHWLRRMCLI